MGILSFLLSSCSTPKNITYFKDVPDTMKRKMVEMAAYSTPVIQPDDILQVTIQTLDPGATGILNQQNNATWPVMGNGNSPANNIGGSPAGDINGYIVDKNGYVILPLIGKVNVKDKTTTQVRDEIRTKAEEYFKEPVVNVRFANFKITVLGEVLKPSAYVMPNEKVTLLDAIGIAGDLTIYGKRENVLLIRDENGKKLFIRFNLNDSNVFASPYFYLHQGDVIYVEPNRDKAAATDLSQVRKLSIITSVLTVLIIIVSRINF
jgi:polysaccharide export outer membrane protein